MLSNINWSFEYSLSISSTTQEANLVEEVEDSPDFWSGPVQSHNSPVEHRFLIGLDRSTNGPLPDCDRKYVSVWTMPPGKLLLFKYSAGQKFRTLISWIFCDPLGGGGPIFKMVECCGQLWV